MHQLRHKGINQIFQLDMKTSAKPLDLGVKQTDSRPVIISGPGTKIDKVDKDNIDNDIAGKFSGMPSNWEL
jgi:hypothetical protein